MKSVHPKRQCYPIVALKGWTSDLHVFVRYWLCWIKLSCWEVKYNIFLFHIMIYQCKQVNCSCAFKIVALMHTSFSFPVLLMKKHEIDENRYLVRLAYLLWFPWNWSSVHFENEGRSTKNIILIILYISFIYFLETVIVFTSNGTPCIVNCECKLIIIHWGWKMLSAT